MAKFNLKKAVGQLNAHCEKGGGFYCDMPGVCHRMFSARAFIPFPSGLYEGWLEGFNGERWIKIPSCSTFRQGTGTGQVYVARLPDE